MKNMGTFTAPIVHARKFTAKVNDSAIQNGMASLVSELEKRNPRLREPLTSLTYTRDIPVKVGGGWVEFISAMSIDYGVTGGSGDGVVSAGGANATPLIQANFDKDTWKTHAFEVAVRIMHVDLERSKITGRSLDEILTRGVRHTYDKHMEQNVYFGISKYGSFGLLNNPNIAAANVADNGSGSTAWDDKTAEQIRDDINEAINAAWEQAGYDREALPNHILLPYEQFNKIVERTNSDLANISILEYLLENNITKANGGELFIGATQWNKGIGAGGKDRMAVYCHNERYLAVEELAPLSRIMTAPNATEGSYDSRYAANLSEVEYLYTQTAVYRDGI
ncbi:MAG: DUF2184 domain-containing protein [Oscillospiraceae bacterium]|jgi:hypothetical protein|nr:DUF2184 domain-containing protein [Oscillospiraceae bacterium]